MCSRHPFHTALKVVQKAKHFFDTQSVGELRWNFWTRKAQALKNKQKKGSELSLSRWFRRRYTFHPHHRISHIGHERIGSAKPATNFRVLSKVGTLKVELGIWQKLRDQFHLKALFITLNDSQALCVSEAFSRRLVSVLFRSWESTFPQWRIPNCNPFSWNSFQSGRLLFVAV